MPRSKQQVTELLILCLADAAVEAPIADAAAEVPATSDAATSSLDPVDAALEHPDASVDASGADTSSATDGELATSTTASNT